MLMVEFLSQQTQGAFPEMVIHVRHSVAVGGIGPLFVRTESSCCSKFQIGIVHYQ